MEKVNIFFFSGTGNSFKVVQAIKEELNEYSVNVYKIEDVKDCDLNCDLLIFSFPIAVFFTYPLVLDFIKKLPKGNGQDVMAIPTMGGTSIVLKPYLRDIFINKNYNPIAYKEIIMPGNLQCKDEKAKELSIINKGLADAKNYIKKVLSNETNWDKSYFRYILSVLFYPLFKLAFYFFKSRIKLDKSKCVKCGLCSEICPVENIILEDYPVFLGKCQACIRCISFCPTSSIYLFKDQKVYRAEGVDRI